MKKFIAILLTVALTATIAISGTLAYLTDRDSEANVFTVGNVSIDLEEDFDQGATLIPGVDIEKKPTITNTGKNDAWVWATIAIPSALDDDNDASKNVVHFNYSSENVGEGLWTWTDSEGNWMVETVEHDGVSYNVYTVLYQTPLKPGEITPSVMEKVYMDPHVDIDPNGNMAWVENGVVKDLGWNVNDNSTPLIYVSAHAIQTEGFTTVQDAYEAYNEQWGNNGTEWPIPESLEDTTLEIVPGDSAENRGTITINSAEDLVYLPKLAAEWASLYSASGNGDNFTDYKNGQGAAYYYAWQWTIELGTDIDLRNIPVKPIDTTFWGTIDGNGHTISNVVVDSPETGFAGLFSVTRGLVKDLNVDNVKVLGTEKNDNVGAVVGYCRGSMDNVRVTNAFISGCDYVGTVAGKVEGGITNSSATNATVTATGKTAGGLVGYTLGDTTGNTVDNVTVTGLYNIGGLTGQAQNKTVENNTVKNATLISTSEIPTDKNGDYVRTGEVVARNYNATVGENTVENVSMLNQ